MLRIFFHIKQQLQQTRVKIKGADKKSCELLANSDQWTDKAAYSVACTQLKISWSDHLSQGNSVLFSQGR